MQDDLSQSMDARSPRMIAAVDLGSNSFHLKVASVQNNSLKIIDRMREMVRLGGGLDDKQRLTAEVQTRALECLGRFGERLRGIPSENVRIVGTNTLRKARNSRTFIGAWEAALGHPIEIISGIEEARLIYQGVAHSLAADDDQERLVVDIGGGSSEIIIGRGFKPMYLESLYMGCVSMSKRYFGKGVINTNTFRKAQLSALVELEPIMLRYRKIGWSEAIGASGTIRAAARLTHDQGWCPPGSITASGLKKLTALLCEIGVVSGMSELPGMDPERAPVLPGGIAILQSIFEALEIESMQISDGALREGLLYDLLGRLQHADVRSLSVSALAKRYHTDSAHSELVGNTALMLYRQIAGPWKLEAGIWELLLGWSAQLCEVGLDIAHNQYHKHGAYIVEYSDLAGFSRHEQLCLSILVRAHRRKFPEALIATLPEPYCQSVEKLAILLRLAVLLHRSRTNDLPADLHLKIRKKKELVLQFPSGWLTQHQLLQADLLQEAEYLRSSQFALILVE